MESTLEGIYQKIQQEDLKTTNEEQAGQLLSYPQSVQVAVWDSLHTREVRFIQAIRRQYRNFFHDTIHARKARSSNRLNLCFVNWLPEDVHVLSTILPFFNCLKHKTLDEMVADAVLMAYLPRSRGVSLKASASELTVQQRIRQFSLQDSSYRKYQKLERDGSPLDHTGFQKMYTSYQLFYYRMQLSFSSRFPKKRGYEAMCGHYELKGLTLSFESIRSQGEQVICYEQYRR